MHILYRVTYLPHLANHTPPYYYVGSKYNYNGSYYGSPASKQCDWYTGDLSIAEWWKSMVRNRPDDFLFEVIDTVDVDTPQQLVNEEKKLQLQLDVRYSIEYFNKSIATTGWASSPRTIHTKQKASKNMLQLWRSEEGRKRKDNLSKRNRDTKSQQMKERWQHPTEAMLNRKCHGRPKGAKDVKPRKPRPMQKIEVNGRLYDNALSVSDEFGITPTSVRRRCRMEKYTEWKYV